MFIPKKKTIIVIILLFLICIIFYKIFIDLNKDLEEGYDNINTKLPYSYIQNIPKSSPLSSSQPLSPKINKPLTKYDEQSLPSEVSSYKQENMVNVKQPTILPPIPLNQDGVIRIGYFSTNTNLLY